MNKNLVITVLVAVVIVSGVFWFTKPTQQVVVTKDGQTVGSIASPDVQSNWLRVGGVTQWFYHTDQLTNGASTTCMFQGPAATTSLVGQSVYFSNKASSTVVEMGVSSGPYATTTLTAASVTVAAGTLGAGIVASSTAQTLIVGPSSYFSVKTGGGDTKGTTAPAGSCDLVLRQIAF